MRRRGAKQNPFTPNKFGMLQGLWGVGCSTVKDSPEQGATSAEVKEVCDRQSSNAYAQRSKQLYDQGSLFTSPETLRPMGITVATVYPNPLHRDRQNWTLSWFP
jgi:hypothetical protein